MTDVTLILDAMAKGDARASEELLPLVYAELRRMAAARMAQEAAGQTLQPTALVPEAWLRINGCTLDHGIGTHALSVIAYDLPCGFTEFHAVAGLDDEVIGAAPNRATAATVRFLVFTNQPTGRAIQVPFASLGLTGEFRRRRTPRAPAHCRPACSSKRASRRSKPSRIVTGCGGQPGMKRSTGTMSPAPPWCCE